MQTKTAVKSTPQSRKHNKINNVRNQVHPCFFNCIKGCIFIHVTQIFNKLWKNNSRPKIYSIPLAKIERNFWTHYKFDHTRFLMSTYRATDCKQQNLESRNFIFMVNNLNWGMNKRVCYRVIREFKFFSLSGKSYQRYTKRAPIRKVTLLIYA